MTHARRLSDEGRQFVMLRGIGEDVVLSLEDAIALDPQAMNWVKVVSVHPRKRETCDITLSVSQARYIALTAGLSKSRDIQWAIEVALRDGSDAVIEHAYLSGEVECIPACSKASVFGPYTIVVEWLIHEAFHVMVVVQRSILEVGCIELTRIGRMGQKTVTLAVTLPLSIFDATVTKIHEGLTRRSVSDCLYEAIDEASGREPSARRPEIDADEIPF
jgi:hypothetical protein